MLRDGSQRGISCASPTAYRNINGAPQLVPNSRSIRWFTSLVLLASFVGPRAQGSDQAAEPKSSDPPPPVKLTAQQDHQRIMDLLHIASLRRGADGNNRQAENHANYDE